MTNRLSGAMVIALGALALSACVPATFTPPHISPTPSFITVNPTALQFAGISTAANNDAYDQTVTGTLTAPSSVTVDASSCGTASGPIARASNPVQNGLSLTLTVTPLAAGTCTVTLTTGSGSTASVSITVNNGSVSVSGKSRGKP